MNIVKAILNKGEWLLDALKRIGHSMIPTNSILNKTLTGLGELIVRFIVSVLQSSSNLMCL